MESRSPISRSDISGFSSRKTADILAEETGAKELLFHSCHTVSQQEMDEGASYLTLMNRNADALKEALD